MSRLTGRSTKGYQGGSFAGTFKTALNSGMPFGIIVAGGQSAAAAAKAKVQAAQKSSDDKIVDTIDDRKMKYGREEVDTFFQRKKLAEEQEAFDAKKKGEGEPTPEEIEEQEALEKTASGGDIADSSDGGKGSFGARRGAKKAAKAAAAELCAQQNPEGGKAEKDCFKDKKKGIRKANRKEFFDNTGAKIKGAGKAIGKGIKKLGKKLFCPKWRRKRGKC